MRPKGGIPPFQTIGDERRRLALVFAGALALQAIVAAFYLGARAAGAGFALRGVPLDDVWIHFVYARSIGQGHPFQYNPGQWETGATSPLWAILLAPAAALGIPIVAAGKALGVLLSAAAAAAGYRVAAQIGDRRAGLIFAAGFTLAPYFDFAAVSGTEVSLFVFLMFVTIGAALAERWRLAGIATGLGALARPEGALLVPLLLAALWVGRGSRRERTRRSVELIASTLVLITPWILYCLAATGRPLPAAYYVKSHWYGLFNLGQLRKTGALLASQPFLGEGLGLPALIAVGAIVGVVVIAFGVRRLARGGARAAADAHAAGSRAGAAPLLLVALVGPLFLYAVLTGHPLGALKAPDQPGSSLNFYTARYLLPGIAPLMLVWAIGLSALLGPRLLRRRIGLAMLLLALPIAATVHQHTVLTNVYSWNCRNIEEMQVAAGKWIAANLPAGATVAVSDAGAIRYFGGHPVVDLVGLNTHRLIPLLSAITSVPVGSPEEARLRAQFWSDRPPDYLAITRGWHQSLIREVRAEILKTFDLEHNTICGGVELVVAKPVAPGAGKTDPER